jgi:hypothetical protein
MFKDTEGPYHSSTPVEKECIVADNSRPSLSLRLFLLVGISFLLLYCGYDLTKRAVVSTICNAGPIPILDSILEGRNASMVDRYVTALDERVAPLLIAPALSFLLWALGLSCGGQSRSVAYMIGCGVVLRLLVAWRDPLRLQLWPLSDDSFYYFNIARNIVSGNGVCHDSFHQTDGFQPLFMGLASCVYAFAGHSAHVINILLTVQVAIGAACAVIMVDLTRFLSRESRISFFVALVWAVHLPFLAVDLNGMETNLALLLTLLSGRLLTRSSSLPERMRVSFGTKLGILWGLGFLARVDTILWIMIQWIWLVVVKKKVAGRWTRALAYSVLPCGVALAIASPWIVYVWRQTGGLLPTSGEATRFLSLLYYGGWPPRGGDGVPVSFYRLQAGMALRAYRKILSPPLASLAILSAASCFGRRFRRSLPTAILPWIVFGTLILVAYPMWIFGPWFYTRYFTPVLVITVIAACTAAITWMRMSAVWHRIVLYALPVVALGCAWPTMVQLCKGENRQYSHVGWHLAQWINRNTSKNDIVGGFQTGVLGYYLDRRFVALDGKVNRDALEALRGRWMDRYIRSQGIVWLAEESHILRASLARTCMESDFLNRQPEVYRYKEWGEVREIRSKASCKSE